MSGVKKIDVESGSACSSTVNIFNVKPSNVCFQKSSYKEYLPLATVTNEGPYVFRVHSDTNWLDCSRTYFYLEVSIEKNDKGKWVALEDIDEISTTNNFANSFIRNLKIDLNGVEISDSNNLNPYRDYLTTLLSYSNEIKNSQLAAVGYYTDDGKDQNSNINPGVIARSKLFTKSTHAHFMGKLNYDLANQPLALLNNTDLVFTIQRSSDKFLIIQPSGSTNTVHDFRILVHNIKLYIKNLEVAPSINLAILQKLLTTPAKYCMRKIEMRSTFLTAGRTELTHNIFTNIIPRRIIFGLVASPAYNGDFTTSPFNFEPFDIRSASIEANGIIYPLAPYNLDFPNNNYVRAFNDFYENIGYTGVNKTCGISYIDYKSKGYTLFAFQMTSDLTDSNGFELIKNGTTVIKLLFNKAIPNNGVELIALAEFDSVLTITNDRVVISDGSA